MSLSGSSIEMLVDLVEIKMLYMAEDGPHDQRTIAKLSKCRQELIATARDIGGVRLVPMSLSD